MVDKVIFTDFPVTPSTGLNFLEACKLMRADRKVRRKAWAENNSDNLLSSDWYCIDTGYFILVNSYDPRLSVEDCLADDWEEYNAS